MIAALFLSVLSSPSGSFAPAAPFRQEAGDAEADAQIAAAGQDAAKLLELAKSFSAGGKDDAAKKVYKKIVEVDPNHAEARKALRHHAYDGKWFESYAELSKYRREETAKMKDKGLARWKDQWVAEGDVPYLNMGWIKDDAGKWKNPVEVERAKQVGEWEKAGYKFRADDCTWVAPADFAKWEQLLWSCGGEWLDMQKADEFHAKIPQWWELDGSHFSTWSTCDWKKANQARFWADQVYADLVRVTGLHPTRKPHFLILSSLEQYNQFSAGDQAAQLPQAESEGFSSLHHGFFADILFDPSTTPFQFKGCGVGYWVNDDWAPFSVRFAAGLSFMEAIDPSWLAISEIIASFTGGSQPNPGAFWTEKRIPRWMHYGAASYVERFAKLNTGDGGNPWQMREDSLKLLKTSGGMRKIEDVFAFALDVNDIEGSGRMIQEAGVIVSFLLDGADGDKKLKLKHDAFKAALRSGNAKDLTEAIEGLQKELAKNEKDIKKFADV